MDRSIRPDRREAGAIRVVATRQDRGKASRLGGDRQHLPDGPAVGGRPVEFRPKAEVPGAERCDGEDRRDPECPDEPGASQDRSSRRHRDALGKSSPKDRRRGILSFGQILCGDGHDPAAERWRRIHELDGRRERRHDLAELDELRMRFGARGEMVAHLRLLMPFEGTEDECRGEIANLVARHLPTPWMPSSPPSSADVPPSPRRARRSARSPSRIRLLTVPSGVAVRSAISCWVRPPK